MLPTNTRSERNLADNETPLLDEKAYASKSTKHIADIRSGVEDHEHAVLARRSAISTAEADMYICHSLPPFPPP